MILIIIIGLILLVAAVVVGVTGVLSNHGSGHALTHPFAVFGYHVTCRVPKVGLSAVTWGDRRDVAVEHDDHSCPFACST